MADFATAGGHWYAFDGSPQYTIVGANGKERPTTLRDARKLNLVPSVTGIIRTAAAPALEQWKRNQVLLAALTLPRSPDEAESAWLARVENDWQEQGRAAAERGTRIHGAVEKYFRNQLPDEDVWPWAEAAKDCLLESCKKQLWSAERSFACDLGYGGKTDLHSPEWVVDIKTKDGAPDGKLYDEHLMQLAAYRDGLKLGECRCGILFVQRETPKATFVEASADELRKARAMFHALLMFWQAKNGYWPAREEVAA